MFKRLIYLIVPFAFISMGFTEKSVIKLPEDVPIADNYYDPDKNIDTPIPIPEDINK